MSSLDHLFSSDTAALFGLPPSEWEVAIDKFKTPFGRRVVVGVRKISSGRELTDSVVGSRLTKRDLDRHAAELVAQLSSQLGFRETARKRSGKKRGR